VIRIQPVTYWSQLTDIRFVCLICQRKFGNELVVVRYPRARCQSAQNVQPLGVCVGVFDLESGQVGAVVHDITLEGDRVATNRIQVSSGTVCLACEALRS
jgi:hypothetical protein